MACWPLDKPETIPGVLIMGESLGHQFGLCRASRSAPRFRRFEPDDCAPCIHDMDRQGGPLVHVLWHGSTETCGLKRQREVLKATQKRGPNRSAPGIGRRFGGW